MKRFIKVFIVLMVFGFCIPVFATDHSVKELIPISEPASVDTETFTYGNITYSPVVPNHTFGRFSFQSIKNKTDKQVPVSVGILLFDESKINIGYVTYCSDEDAGGDYSHKKIAAGQAIPFYINVGAKYFAEGKGPADVKYFAVYDDNKYCHIGGYTNYVDLTMEDINNGKVVTEYKGEKFVVYDQKFNSMLSSVSLTIIFWAFMISFVVFVIRGLILNALHKRMYEDTTPFAFLPICTDYIAVKLAFGPMFAKIYMIILVLSGPISLVFPPIVLLSTLVTFVAGIAFILDIIKLISKNYKLCYFEQLDLPEQDNEPKLRLPSKKTKVEIPKEEVVEDVPEEKTEAVEEEDPNDPGGQILDLNYDTSVSISTYMNEDNNGFSSSNNSDVPEEKMEEKPDNKGFVDLDDLEKNVVESAADDSANIDEDLTKNEEEGESDLMNLFK